MVRFTRRQVLAVGVGSLAGLAFGQSPAMGQEDGSWIRYGDERRYHVVHRGDFQNGDVQLESLELWIPVPQDAPEQTVQSIEVRPRVPIVREANGLARVAKFYGKKDLPRPGASMVLEVSYEVTVRRIATDLARLARNGPPRYANADAYRLFTRPERKIESDHPAIIEQAEKLRGQKTDPVEIARAAYDWVLENVEYQLIEGFGGAAWCLEKGHGECGDYSALFVALCRAAGVPARLVSGFWADRTDGWHCWAEFLLPEGQWIPVDASLGDQNWFSRRYYFGSLDNRRVALCRTSDIELVDRSGGNRTRDFLQNGAWWWRGRHTTLEQRPPTVQFRVSGRRLGDEGAEDGR
ncbi:MAG: transglutaminase domain-containing protein [Rhodopirellula sp.]|nr:transglutaminase domain-containing protein [Rhodopirellula sp.]